MFKINTLKVNLTRFALLCTFLVLAGSSPAAADQGSCAGATLIDPNTTLRGHGGDGETYALRLDVPGAGIVSVDVSVPGAARSAPRIGFIGCPGESTAEPRAVMLEHSAGRLSFAVRESGTYYLRAGAQDPRQALGDFKVRTAFVDAEAIDRELTIEIGGRQVRVLKTDFRALGGLEKTEIADIDPDPFLHDSEQEGVLLTHATLVPVSQAKTEIADIDPDPLRTEPAGSTTDRLEVVLLYDDVAAPTAKTEIADIDPDPLTAGPANALRLEHVVTGLVTTFSGSGQVEKTEIADIDPDPVVLPVDPEAPGTKTEIADIDPDPVRGGSESFGVRTSTHRVTFYADSPASGQAGVLRWISEQIWPDGARRGLNDDRFRLHSYDPAANVYELSLLNAGLCRGPEADDHGDSLPCATRFSPGRVIGGELGNEAADDADFFSFTVAGLKTVSLESTGGTDTLGTLYDRFGQRLEWDDDGGDGTNFRIVKTLSPGIYFLRVEGSQHDEGSYRVALRELEW